MKKNILVSIILVTYNSSKYLIESLNGILNQTYNELEFVIADDCSTDDTISIVDNWLQSNSKRFKIVKKIISPINKGTAININNGIEQSSGDWIIPIAGDDVLMPNYIETMLLYVDKNPKIQLLYSDIEYIDSDSHVIYSKNKFAYSKFNSVEVSPSFQNEVLLRYNPVFSVSLMFSKDLFRLYGLFDEKFPLCEDLFYLIKMTSNNIKIYYADFIGVKYRKHNNSVQIKNKVIMSKFDYDYWNGLMYYAIPHYPLCEKMIVLLYLHIIIFFKKVFHNQLTFLSSHIILFCTFLPKLFLKVIRIKYYIAIRNN